MSADPLIDRLVDGLRPVRRRTVWADAFALLLLLTLELALCLALGMSRSDMAMAMHHASFWWKLASLGLIGLLSGAVALLSLDPARSPRPGLRRVVLLVALCLAVGWPVDLARDGLASLLARLDWPDGLRCVYKMVVLAVPGVIGLGLVMRRGAPTDRGRTALAAGIAAGAWGAFVFVFACPVDDPLYLAVWYTAGCGLVALLARLALPPLTRW